MEVRDKLNSIEGYREIIDKTKNLIDARKLKIKDLEQDERDGVQNFPKANNDIIKSTLVTLTAKYFNLIIAQYSIGKDFEVVDRTYSELLNCMESCWNMRSKDEFKHGFNTPPYYTTDNYWQLLTLISIGIILDVDDEKILRIIKIRDKVETSDRLLDFLINSRVSRKVGDTKMLYNKYIDLIDVIDIKEKEKALLALKKYLSRQWFNDFKEMGWGESHKTKHNIHCGYWSFESGAIVKILALDDGGLKDQPYYPYDMVHWKD